MEDHCERDDQHQRPVRRAHPRRAGLRERALPAPVPCWRLFSGARRIVRSFAVPRRRADPLFTERGRRALSRAARCDALELFHLSRELRMTDESYPRDMIGYGRTPPFADWPKHARIAVQLVINCQEGGENNVLHGDTASGGGCGDERGRVGDRHPWPQVGRLSRYSARNRGPPHRRGGADSYRGRRLPPARLLSGPVVGQHHTAWHGRGRVCLLRRHLC